MCHSHSPTARAGCQSINLIVVAIASAFVDDRTKGSAAPFASILDTVGRVTLPLQHLVFDVLSMSV